MTKAEVLELLGDFTWNYNNEFFIETNKGNFIWSTPHHHGDNSLKKVEYDYPEWLKINKIPFGRSKGKHFIKDYCGTEIVFNG